MTKTSADNKSIEADGNDGGDPVTLRVSDVEAKMRLDKWLVLHLPELSRARIKSLIEKDEALQKDGETFTNASWKIREGETYTLTPPPIEDAIPKPEDIHLTVLYEDEHLIVIDKAAGMVVHPAAGNWSGTLVNALLHHCGDTLSGIGGVARPGIVHRLDKDTSGVMVVAKHDKAHHGLREQFSVHDIERVYHAIVHGAPRPGVGTIDAALARAGADRKKMSIVDEEEHSSARHAITHYKMLEKFGTGLAKIEGDSIASLVECRLETGRTHQIRAHMAHIGHPLLGDPVYGRTGVAGLKPGTPASDAAIAVLGSFRRQALHARQLGFIHPITDEEMFFETDPPEDFARLLESFRKL
ncbi:RluA family pseudouridine synthase [Parvularcula flava]|uniref:Pseudouridine synthase n=1 Tax=Aquisalinus luteolus TaxID=1566827 RepID=A0A8J3ES35_9PROT|nr:RluA family pseudouridine synthase [Aquisalinus luteolus]NHK28864.1 RluA family pseudouridine synthase [Aquisalinus luteolus]GGH99747.1 pseudouridine synthase [Aquisalinus luteolus]